MNFGMWFVIEPGALALLLSAVSAPALVFVIVERKKKRGGRK